MMRTMMMCVLLLQGCAYKVAISSVPAGAEVLLPDGSTITTPGETVLRWAPFNKQSVTVLAAGYRPITVDLRRSELRAGRIARDSLLRPATLAGAPRGYLSVILVPEHGAVGTWTEDEVP